MWRGIERILKGRDPREAWIFAERICGVCTVVHALASIRAVESALGIEVPPMAQAMRNMMLATQFVHDHVLHFYHLHSMDWVDVPNALNADPQKAAEIASRMSRWERYSASYFRDVLVRLKNFFETGRLGIFAKGYWDHPDYKLPPEVDLILFTHFMEALDWQKHMVRIQTFLGGKNPHPNFLVGGAPLPVDMNSPTAMNITMLGEIKKAIGEIRQFVREVYIPDLIMLASYYEDWFHKGKGVMNFLTYGEFPDGAMRQFESMFFPRGAILNGNLSRIYEVDPLKEDEIMEVHARSWYEDGDEGLHPFEGKTRPRYTGPEPPYDYLNVDDKYSWIKAPRWKGNPMEVGPLARMLVGYALGHHQIVDRVEYIMGKLNIPIEAFVSTMGRTLARGVETWILSEYLEDIYNTMVSLIKEGRTKTFNREKWLPGSWPREARGVGVADVPRGALAHWVVIKDGKIENYQVIAPSTWNFSPRDHKGQPGPVETALEGTRIEDPNQPVEILRIVHSYDPCMACAVHLLDPRGTELYRLIVE